MGFVADLYGGPATGSCQGLTVLERLATAGPRCRGGHRDGSGILVQVPDRFLRDIADDAGLPFLPRALRHRHDLLAQDPDDAAKARARSPRGREEGLDVLGWREVPSRAPVSAPAPAGTARIEQVFLAAAPR